MNKQNNLSELDMLAERVMQGDPGAYDKLLSQARPALQAYFARQFRAGAAAEDLTQETLLALHTKFYTYRSGSPFAPWLYAIAKYKAIDYLRANRRRTAATEVPLDDTLVAGENVLAQNANHDLTNMLATLSTRDRALLQLAKVDGLSLKQISQQLNISISAVKVGIHRAMKRLTGTAKEQE